MRKISHSLLNLLKNEKNLLAFSAGVDSTALFFILLRENIEFDIAIVDYNLRVDSKKEVAYAKELALKYNKKLFTKSLFLQNSNFEKNARDIRYNFFEKLIKTYNYQNLLTAHQLNDKLEWFFMQLSRGAGVVELLGFTEIDKRENYRLIRPLIEFCKDELEEFLKENQIKYFVDKSNFSTKYKRNLFRENFSNNFLKEYKEGVIKSFRYLEIDKNELLNMEIIFQKKDFYILKEGKNENETVRIVDKIVKKLGTLLSFSQKQEILKTKDCVISGKIAITLFENKIYISPFVKTVMPKEFKEKCRIFKIPPKLRGYLFKESIKVDRI